MFKFTSDQSDLEVDGMIYPKITFEITSKATIPDMLQAFEDFLKATGYNFNGHIDMIEDEKGDIND